MPTINAHQDRPQTPVRGDTGAVPVSICNRPPSDPARGMHRAGKRNAWANSSSLVRMTPPVRWFRCSQHQSLRKMCCVSAHRPLFHHAATVRAAAFLWRRVVMAYKGSWCLPLNPSSGLSTVAHPSFPSPATIRDRSDSIDLFRSVTQCPSYHHSFQA